MTAPCLTPVDVCALRVTSLDDNGTPLVGASSAVVRNLVQIQKSTVISTGQSFEQRDGCGNICASRTGQDKITGVTLELQLCQYDFALAAILTEGTLVTGDVFTSNGPIGLDLPSSTAPNSNGVVVEAWSPAMDGSEQAVSQLGDPVYFHYVWPKVTWVPGQTTLAEGVILTTFTGKGSENSQVFDGPFDDFPTQPQGAEYVFFDTSIPDITCGYETVIAS
jgi:hypothetical protein